MFGVACSHFPSFCYFELFREGHISLSILCCRFVSLIVFGIYMVIITGGLGFVIGVKLAKFGKEVRACSFLVARCVCCNANHDLLLRFRSSLFPPLADLCVVDAEN